MAEKIKTDPWKYLLMSGSQLGNTSFLVNFVKNIILGEEAAEFSRLDRMIGIESKILYIRSEAPKVSEKASLEKITKMAFIEYIESPEIFNYRTIIQYLQNRNYTYLIVDDPRQDYAEQNAMDNFPEVLNFCDGKIKVISSLVSNRQKIDYAYHEADLIFDIEANLTTGYYEVNVEDEKTTKIKKYLIPLK